MLSVLAAILFFVALGWAAVRRPAFMLAGVFLFWQFMLKILGVVYLDIAGPIFSDEVGTEVGGVGHSTFLMMFFIAIPVFFLYVFMKPSRNARPPPPEHHLAEGGVTFADVVVYTLGLFAVALYVDMIVRGDIPLFTGKERFEYVGGVFHNLFTGLIFLFAFVLGWVFVRGRIVAGNWDLRCFGLLLVFFAYLVLAGHRFGAFYVMCSFIALALAGLQYARAQGWPVAASTSHSSWGQKLAQSSLARTVGGLSVVGLVAAAMLNNLFFVRGYGENTGDALAQRLFVQPVHLYWLTWDRLRAGEISDVGAAVDFIFNNPLDAARNTGIQYLMFLNLGEDRSESIVLDQQVDYAGGYPEIAIELGGIWLGALLAVLAALFMAYLYRLCVAAIARGHFLTSVFSIYVCYGFLSFYLGGMVTFLLAWTYWLKLALLVLAVVLDHLLDKSGSRLFPWVLFPRRARAVAPPPLGVEHRVDHRLAE